MCMGHGVRVCCHDTIPVAMAVFPVCTGHPVSVHPGVICDTPPATPPC